MADEFADELNNLGVRVSALENRVGNVKMTGDARIRYINQEKDDNGNGRIKNDNSWSYRVRLRANAQVNDKTKVPTVSAPATTPSRRTILLITKMTSTPTSLTYSIASVKTGLLRLAATTMSWAATTLMASSTAIPLMALS